jgi:hypothetical protein
MATRSMDFLVVGASVNQPAPQRGHVPDASEITRMKRIASTFRPYVAASNAAGQPVLPKGNYIASQDIYQAYRLGYRYGPIYDGTFKRPQQ